LAKILAPLTALLLLSAPCLAASSPSSVISTTSVPATNTTANPNQPSSAIDALRNLGRGQSFENTGAQRSNFTDPAAIEAAANRGDAIAQFNLGHQFESGAGKDFTEAAKWYRKSAQQGYARAQYNLGYFYDQGYGVPQDYEQAYFWWTLAAQSGDAAYASKRDSLELFLSSGQIAGVREKVAAWKPASAKDTADPLALQPHKHRDCKDAGQGACDDEQLHDNHP
jgi:TPR repeat protein